MLDAAFLIPAFPLLGFITILVFGRRLGEPGAGWVATLAMGGSFAAALLTFLGLVAEDKEERRFVQTLWEWVPVGDFSVDIGFLVDPLSITMTLFITGVGALIHLYSIGYMHGDENFSKFFLYLNLFAFSMLMLVLGDNMLLTFLGWEGVGACSYFLISFWFTEEANATAGKKAFVTNRVGDWGCSRRSARSSTSTSSATPASCLRTPPRRSPSCSSLAQRASQPSSRFTCGFLTPWLAQHRFRRSSTPPPWSPRVSTC